MRKPWSTARRGLRAGLLAAMVAGSLPVLESGAGAAPVVTVSPATITYTDTAGNDSFAEVRGTASSSSAVSIDGGSNSLPNPPNTAVVFYTSGKVGTYGTLWMQNSGAWVYEPNIRAINGATGTVTDTFTFKATDSGGTGTQNLVVTVNGVEDTPVLTVSSALTNDITDDLSVSTICGTGAGSGDPYQIDLGSSPSNERCHLAFDNSTSTKYLNFTRINSSVLVDLKRPWMITKVGLTTANDAAERDPTGFDLYGSNTSLTSGMTLIQSVSSLTAPSARFTAYDDVAITGAAAYRYLKFTVTSTRGVGNSNQISEIRFGGTTSSTSYTEGDPPMTIEPTFGLSDDNTASATVSITSGLTSGDVLSFTNDGSTMGSIAGSWNAGTGVLSLTGSGTVLQWQSALRAVKYSSTSANPTATSAARTVTWSVTDAAARNTTATSSFPVIANNSVPVLAGASPLAVSTSTTTAIAPSLTVSDGDSDDFNGGSLVVSGATTGDVISIDTATGATNGAVRTSGSSIQRYDGSTWVTIGSVSGGNASTYTITFSSAAVTPAVAQAVARAVRITVDATARTRTLSVTVSDGDGGTSSAVSIPTTSSSGVAASMTLRAINDTGVSSTDRITKAATLVFQASFSVSISGLEAGDFSFSGTGATGCAATPSGNSAPITVTVTGCSAGTVTMTLAANAVQAASDATKQNEQVSAPTVTIDRTAPTITLSTTTSSPTRSTTVAFVASAGETLDCSSFEAGDLVLTGLSAIGAVSAATNSCQFNGFSSIALGSSGSSGVGADTDFQVADIAGNVATSASGSPSVTVDRTVPSVTAATLASSSDTGESSSDRVTNAASLTFNVTFNESVIGIAGTDFRNSGTAENCTFAVSAATGSSVTVTASSCGEGTVVLTVRPESLSGANGDGPATEFTSAAVTIDRTAPTRNSLTPADNATSVARGANLVMVHSEVVHRKTGNITIYGPGNATFATIGVTAAQVTGTGTDTITINPSSDLGAGGTYYVNIPSGAFADVAGNSVGAISGSTTWNFQTVDNLAPASSVSIAATQIQTTSVSLSYSVTEEGGLSSLKVYYSASASLTSPTECGTTNTSSLSGTITCTIPDVLGTYYFYTRGTDTADNTETAPNSADDSVELFDPLPTSSVTAPATSRSRTITVNYTSSDNGSVASLVVYASTSASLTSPTECATVASPAATGTASCELPDAPATYYLFSRATDNRSQTEAVPGSADATVVLGNNRPVSAITSPATTRARRITLNYTTSDDGSVASVKAYYSTSASLTSPTQCGTVSNPSASGTFTCTLPVTPGTFYLYSRATDDDGFTELAPGSADDTVVFTNNRPTSSVLGPSTSTARAISLVYSTSDDGSVAQLTAYYSTSATLSSPTSCGTETNPGAAGSITCTLPNTSRTYYVWSLAVDDQDREESDPTEADVVVALTITAAAATTTTTTTAPATVEASPAGGSGSGGGATVDVPPAPVATVPTATTLAKSATTTTTTTTTTVPLAATGRTVTATTTTTTTTTTLPPTVGVPMVETGEAAIVMDGETQKASVTKQNGEVRFQWRNLWAVIKAVDKNGVPIGLDAEGNIRVTPEARVEVTASGFKPGSVAEAWVFSTPTKIGRAQVGADGKTGGVYPLPKKLSTGDHRIVLTGVDERDKQVKFALGITVVEPPQSASRTVIIVMITLAVGFGFLIPPVRRRRRLGL